MRFSASQGQAKSSLSHCAASIQSATRTAVRYHNIKTQHKHKCNLLRGFTGSMLGQQRGCWPSLTTSSACYNRFHRTLLSCSHHCHRGHSIVIRSTTLSSASQRCRWFSCSSAFMVCHMMMWSVYYMCIYIDTIIDVHCTYVSTIYRSDLAELGRKGCSVQTFLHWKSLCCVVVAVVVVAIVVVAGVVVVVVSSDCVRNQKSWVCCSKMSLLDPFSKSLTCKTRIYRRVVSSSWFVENPRRWRQGQTVRFYC